MQRSKSIRVFKNPFLESLTHVHPITPLLLWAPIISYLIYYAWIIDLLSIKMILLLGALGLFIWTLTEYVLHRYIFHFPATSTTGKYLVFLFHGLHHDDPDDATRLVMPPVPALIYSFILYHFFMLFLGQIYVKPFFAFFMVGYLCYDYIHYYTHHFIPKSKWGKYLRNYHLIHHHGEPGAKFGVSSPLWDIVFGTKGKKKIQL